jgi:hypothetical protein
MCAVPNVYGSKNGLESDNNYSVASEESDTTTGSTRFLQTVERLAPRGGVEFSGAVFRQLIGPGVYVWLRGDTALYVGASATAFSRAADRRHHRIQLGKDVVDEDAVLFYACATMAEALILEHELIGALRPTLNRRLRWATLSARLGFTRVGHFTRQYLPQPAPDPSS